MNQLNKKITDINEGFKNRHCQSKSDINRIAYSNLNSTILCFRLLHH
jgi:hypothetical protein